MEADKVSSAIKNHLQAFFVGHKISEFVWPLGPIQEVLPRFRVLRVSPGSRCNLWVYVSSGAWGVDSDQQSGLEFMIFAPEESPRHVELLAMSAHYHFNHDLDLGHTYPIGEPWLEGSACDHMLVRCHIPSEKSLNSAKSMKDTSTFIGCCRLLSPRGSLRRQTAWKLSSNYSRIASLSIGVLIGRRLSKGSTCQPFHRCVQ